MKKPKLLSLFVFIFMFISLSSADLTTNNTLYFSLDNSSIIGNNINDSSGNNNGTNIGTNWTTGILNEARLFDGVDDYINVSNPSTYKYLNNFSISTWVNFLDTGNYEVIFAATNDPNTGQGTGYYAYKTDTEQIQFYHRIDASNAEYVLSNSTITTNEWIHLVFTKSAISGMKIYINGTLDKNDTSATTNVFYDATTPYFDVGVWDNDGVKESYINGSIDEFSIWNRTLTQSEITQLYNSGGGINPYINLSYNFSISAFSNWTGSIINNFSIIINGSLYNTTTGVLVTNISSNISSLFNLTVFF